MKETRGKSLCPICGGRKAPAKTTMTIDFGFGILVVRDVPSMRCVQCGEEWLSSEEARLLEKLVKEAKARKTELEVVRL